MFLITEVQRGIRTGEVVNVLPRSKCDEGKFSYGLDYTCYTGYLTKATELEKHCSAYTWRYIKYPDVLTDMRPLSSFHIWYGVW